MFSFTDLLLDASFSTISLKSSECAVETLVLFHNHVWHLKILTSLRLWNLKILLYHIIIIKIVNWFFNTEYKKIWRLNMIIYLIIVGNRLDYLTIFEIESSFCMKYFFFFVLYSCINTVSLFCLIKIHWYISSINT